MLFMGTSKRNSRLEDTIDFIRETELLKAYQRCMCLDSLSGVLSGQVPVLCQHDRFGLVNGHENMLRRLSLKAPAAHVHDRALPDSPDELSEEALELLKLAVARPKNF